MSIIFLEPVFMERIWGGTKLKEEFNYPLKSDHIGECWAISAHKNGSSKVISGPFKGLTLKFLYENYKKELFNNDPSEKFPLLIKILDANDNLSVQVHPDDHYALKHEDDYGKTECWYVINAEEDAVIIDGHHAQTKLEFIKKIKENDLSLWNYRNIKKDDFISIPAKRVHAIGKGALIYEVQQSSDTTYRLYDYNRVDAQGKKRELHLEKALKIVDIPSKDVAITVKKTKDIAYDSYHYIRNKYFDFKRIDVKTEYQIDNRRYALCSVLDGKGFIDRIPLKKGDHFIVPATPPYKKHHVKGELKLMIIKRP